MAKNSKIEWTNHTANLWWGCTERHLGCMRCYARIIALKYGYDIWGLNKPRRKIMSVWSELVAYQREAKAANEIHKVFVGSMMDIFEVPMPLIDNKSNPIAGNTGELRKKFFDNITNGLYPNLMFLLLTKRPSDINKYIPNSWKVNPPVNVMFGTSISNQKTAIAYTEQLLEVKGSKFLSVEPQISEITLMPWLLTKQIDWVIQGGESGYIRRPFNTDWARKLKAECEATNTPYFFKQIDKVIEIPQDLEIMDYPEEVFSCAFNSACSMAANAKTKNRISTAGFQL